MLFLLALFRGLARVVLGPLVWLMRLLAGFLVLGAGVMFIVALVFAFLPKDPSAHNVSPVLVYFCGSLGMLLLGGVIGAAADLATGLDSALGNWIRLRQLFFVARKAPGQPVREALAKFPPKQS